MNSYKSFLFILASILLISYPVWVYFGLQIISARYLGMLALLFLVIRFLVAKSQIQLQHIGSLIPITLAMSTLFILAIIVNDPLLIKLNPVIFNTVMLILFVMSLIKPPSMIERFARITKPNPNQQTIDYTRKVTIIWSIFFLFNGIIAAITTFYTSMEIWLLYNGFIAYILIGLLFGIEYIVRLLVIKQQNAN